MFLLAFMTLYRGDDLRRLRLSELSLYEVHAVNGPDPITALRCTLDNGKTNQVSKVQSAKMW